MIFLFSSNYNSATTVSADGGCPFFRAVSFQPSRLHLVRSWINFHFVFNASQANLCLN